ncbi:hypothetical protein, partial [Enterobacter hormaechei]|uniref:hypothetical protein n=1 Tax=Enterobacter hormaechei TaxID=158836 RepID=UPI00197A7F40
KRLATEALQRQVIIFTHDIYFLCLLTEEAKQAGATVFTQSLTRRAEGFGIADPELPLREKIQVNASQLKRCSDKLLFSPMTSTSSVC